MSFDVPSHRHLPIEIYGTEGSLGVPDPNWFGGADRARTAAKDWTERADRACPTPSGNYRIIGLADMAHAIRSGRPHRASGELALHVLEVMEAFQRSSDSGTAHRPSRPGPSGRRMLPTTSQCGSLDSNQRKREVRQCAKR